jgi:hypothetical protein
MGFPAAPSPPAVGLGRRFWPATLSKRRLWFARRTLLLQLDTLNVAEHQDIWIRLALKGPPAYMPESLVRHVQPERLSSWRLADQYAYTLPMIERHLAALDDRLSRSKARAILHTRLNKNRLTGRADGNVGHGFAMILRSAVMGYRPLRCLGDNSKAALARMPTKSLDLQPAEPLSS